MVPFQRPNSLFLLVTICFSTILAACSSGSGGGGKGGAPNRGDTAPDAFTIEARTGENFDSWVESAPITISGIDAASPVSINNGGEFRIDNGTFASTASTVRSGQTVTVRVRSSVKAGQSVTATLNVGGVTAPFTVTTGPDTDPPEVAILFPPPASMTEGSTLFLRGTVKDVNGTLEEGAVTVNGVEAELDLNTAGDEGTWSVTVDLEEGENTLTVTAIDVAENENADESISSRRVASIAGESFPDNSNPFGAPINADIGWEDDKPVAYVADDTALKVFKVDLTTGVRTVLAENEGVSEELAFEEPWGVHLGVNGKLYVSDFTRGVIFEVDRETGDRIIVAASDEESFWDSPMGLLLREEESQQKLYVADNLGKLFWINLDSDEQRLVVDSNNGLQPGGELFPSIFGLGLFGQELIVAGRNGLFTAVSDSQQTPLIVDENMSRISSVVSGPGDSALYYVNNTEKSVYAYDAQVNSGVVVAGGASAGVENTLVDIWGIDSDENLTYLLLIDRQNGLIAMDYESKNRVVVSKSVAEN